MSSGIDVRLVPWAALVLRLALGLVFLAHAWLKVAVLTLPVAAAFFERHGFPGWSVYPVFGIELLGGLALVAGWGTRPAALGLAAVVLGAFRVHWSNGWYFAHPDGGWEYLAVLLVGLLAVALMGPGAGALSGTRDSPRAAPRDCGCPA